MSLRKSDTEFLAVGIWYTLLDTEGSANAPFGPEYFLWYYKDIHQKSRWTVGIEHTLGMVE